jgi:hypothetical protein
LIGHESWPCLRTFAFGTSDAHQGFMMIAAIMVGVGLIAEICAVIKAPIGYQDETGFHAGREEAVATKGAVKPKAGFREF